MPGIRSVLTKGFTEASKYPVVVAVGAGLPAGSTTHCQAVGTLVSGFGGCVQLIVTELEVTLLNVNAVGGLHAGAGAQVIFASHPALVTEASLLNLNVKQPSGLVDVNGPGLVVPQYPPANAPGTFAAKFELAICGDAIEFPLKTYKAS